MILIDGGLVYYIDEPWAFGSVSYFVPTHTCFIDLIFDREYTETRPTRPRFRDVRSR